MINFCLTAIVLGFNSTTYDIAEGAGSVLLTIGVREGQFGENVTISVRLSTFSISARGIRNLILLCC